MSWEVHLGSDVELPQVEWEEAVPAFTTQPLYDTEERGKNPILSTTCHLSRKSNGVGR